MFVDLSPLKVADFRRLFFSQTISMIGMQMTMVTVPFQVFQLTKSTMHTGLISIVELVFLATTALWGGVLADSMNRRRMLVICECVMVFLILTLMVNAYLPSPSLWLIYLAAGLLAAVGGFHRPSFEALTPVFVEKADLSKVSVLISMKMVFASLIGPSIAGFLVATVGPAVTYGLDVVALLLSLMFLLQIEASLEAPAVEGDRTSVLAEVREGFVYLKGRKDILASYVVDFCAMVFCMPQVLFPAFADYYGREKQLGILYIATAMGAVVMSLFSSWTYRIRRLGVGIIVSASLWSLSMVVVGAAPNFWWLPVGLFLGGAFDGLSGIFRMTLWNESIPSQYRGRLASFGMLSYHSGPLLGNAFMGFLAASIGLHQALLLGGALGFFAVVMISIAFGEFWSYQSDSELRRAAE